MLSSSGIIHSWKEVLLEIGTIMIRLYVIWYHGYQARLELETSRIKSACD